MPLAKPHSPSAALAGSSDSDADELESCYRFETLPTPSRNADRIRGSSTVDAATTRERFEFEVILVRNSLEIRDFENLEISSDTNGDDSNSDQHSPQLQQVLSKPDGHSDDSVGMDSMKPRLQRKKRIRRRHRDQESKSFSSSREHITKSFSSHGGHVNKSNPIDSIEMPILTDVPTTPPSDLLEKCNTTPVSSCDSRPQSILNLITDSDTPASELSDQKFVLSCKWFI